MSLDNVDNFIGYSGWRWKTVDTQLFNINQDDYSHCGSLFLALKKKLGSQSFELIIQNLEERTPNFELGIPKFWVNKLKICVIIELWVTVFFPEAEKIFLRKILIEIW